MDTHSAGRRTPIVLSWSGGKDSSLALETLRRSEEWEVVGLLTSVTRDHDRISIHGVRRTLLEAQATSLRLPLFEISLAAACSNDAYEAAFRSAVDKLRLALPQLRHLAFGDLFLSDVRAYREALLAPLRMEAVFPLWGIDTTLLARQFIASGYRAHLVCVDTQQLGASFAGRPFDEGLLEDLGPEVDPCGERGEFHTFVSDGPIFSRPIPVRLGEAALREERFAYRDLVPGEG